jgi:hypothetical protein
MELPFTAYSPKLSNTSSPNGRVNFNAPPSAGGSIASVSGFDYQRAAETNFQTDMLRGNWEKNSLSDTFFSNANMKIIQNLIKKEVYSRSLPKGGYHIDDQSADELKIIMRAMYYQYARNLPHNISGQVKELNQRVADWSVPHILSAVDHHMFYLKDVESLPVPISHPVHISRAGTKSLPQSPFM